MLNILQCGVPKSGNFWLYRIIQEILLKSGRETTSFIEQQPVYEFAKRQELNFPGQARIDVLDVTDQGYSSRISSIYRMNIADIHQYAAQSPHVWSHSPVCKRSAELFGAFDKKLYIIRDPRDMLLSAAKYYCSDYMLKYFPQPETDPEQFLLKNFDRLLHEWIWHVYDHLRLSKEYNIHLLLYEDLKQNFHPELSRLLHYLEIDLSEKQKEKITEAVSFESMKKSSPKHLQKGDFGYWKDKLSFELQERARNIAGPLIRYFGYPETAADDYKCQIPVINDYSELKAEILQSQKLIFA